MAVDTTVGMVFSNLIAYFIVLTTAATLHTSGINTPAASSSLFNAVPREGAASGSRKLGHLGGSGPDDPFGACRSVTST